MIATRYTATAARMASAMAISIPWPMRPIRKRPQSPYTPQAARPIRALAIKGPAKTRVSRGRWGSSRQMKT